MSTNVLTTNSGAFGGYWPEMSASQVAPESAHWMALYTTPRHEKNVARYLDCVAIEHYLPVYKARRAWRNRQRIEVELPLFPCYIFARIDATHSFQVLRSPGVVSIVGPGRKPVILDDSEIESLREGLAARMGEPHPFLVVGHKARIRCGAFAGKEGVLVRKETNLRVVLTMDAIMKSFSVEVDGEEVEMVS